MAEAAVKPKPADTAAQDAERELTDGFHLVIDALKLNGINTIYGVPGIPITDLGRMAQAAGMRVISFRHEQNAGNAAGLHETLPEWGEAVRLTGERETLGLYLTGHPIAEYERELRPITSGRIADVGGAKPVGLLKATVGLDGFVDEIIAVVDKRNTSGFSRLGRPPLVAIVAEGDLVILAFRREAPAYVIAAAEKAGFKLDARSDLYANPKDDRDHPFGVWTLPPTRRNAVQSSR